MFSYIIKRIFLMIPTLLGIITICFLLMRLAPGDPLELRLGTLGEQKEGALQREQYKLMAKQFGLDKPMFFNFRALTNYSKEINRYIPFIDDLDAIKSEYHSTLEENGFHVKTARKQEALSFLEKIGVRDINLRLTEYSRLLKSDSAEVEIVLNSVANSTRLGIQIRMEKISKWAVKPLYEKLLLETDII